jgi:WD40 repeat protein
MRRPISGVHVGAPRGSVAFHPEGTFLAYGQSTRELSLADLHAHGTTSLPEPPVSLVFSPDGNALWAGVGKRLVSWRVPDLSVASQWSNDAGEYWKGWSGIASVVVGSQWVIAGSHDENTRVFRARDGSKPVHTWPSPGGPIGAVALSRDETLAVVGTQGGRIRVVRVPDGEPLTDLQGHNDEVTSVAISRDDRLLATGSLDRTIRLWQRLGDHLQERISLPSPTGPVVALRFSPDAKMLAFLVKNESAVRVWHLDCLAHRLDAMNLGW